jgi:hypothetical protein
MEYKLAVERHYPTLRDMRAQQNLYSIHFTIEGYEIRTVFEVLSARNGYTKTEHKITFQIEPSHPILSDDSDYWQEDSPSALADEALQHRPGDAAFVQTLEVVDHYDSFPYDEDTESRTLELVQRLRHDPTVWLIPALSKNCNHYPCKFCENGNTPE